MYNDGLQPLKQLPKLDLQPRGERIDRIQAGVGSSRLHPAHIGPGNPAVIGKLLLRPTTLQTQFADSGAKARAEVGV